MTAQSARGSLRGITPVLLTLNVSKSSNHAGLFLGFPFSTQAIPLEIKCICVKLLLSQGEQKR